MKSQKLLLGTERQCVFSPDRLYRFRLEIRWERTGKLINWLMLNPSTADEVENDPTVERCERRSVAMGYAGLIVTNLFAYRSTDPEALKTVRDPIGRNATPSFDNNQHILRAAQECDRVVCAWGNDGKFLDRGDQVVRLLTGNKIVLHCLRVTGRGQPWHPLYVSYDRQPQIWEPGDTV